MIGIDEDALVCDLAEVYSVFDYHRLPVKLLGTLCSGLGPDSRIGMRIAGRHAPRSTILLAMIRDMMSDALHDEKNRPEHIAPMLFDTHEDETSNKFRTFRSEDDFMKKRSELMGE